MLTPRLLFTPSPFSQPLQYPTDDLDYSQFYDYSEGATDTTPTDEYTEPQVKEKIGRVTCFVIALSVSDPSLRLTCVTSVCLSVTHMTLYLSKELIAAAGLRAEF